MADADVIELDQMEQKAEDKKIKKELEKLTGGKYYGGKDNEEILDVFSMNDGEESIRPKKLQDTLNAIEMNLIGTVLGENPNDTMDDYLLGGRLDRLKNKDANEAIRKRLKDGLIKGMSSQNVAQSYMNIFREAIDAPPTRLSRDEIKKITAANRIIFEDLTPGMKRWWFSKDGVNYRNQLNQILKVRYMSPAERFNWKRKQLFKSAYHAALAKEHDSNYFKYLNNMTDKSGQSSLAMYHQNMKRKAKFYQNRGIDPTTVIDGWKPGKKTIYSKYNEADIDYEDLKKINNIYSQRMGTKRGYNKFAEF